jgi:hypothetical protein
VGAAASDSRSATDASSFKDFPEALDEEDDDLPF